MLLCTHDDFDPMVVVKVIPLENPSADDAFRDPRTTGLPTVECHIIFNEQIDFLLDQRAQLDN